MSTILKYSTFSLVVLSQFVVGTEEYSVVVEDKSSSCSRKMSEDAWSNQSQTYSILYPSIISTSSYGVINTPSRVQYYYFVVVDVDH